MSAFQLFTRTARCATVVFILALLASGSTLLVSVLAGPGGLGPSVTIDQDDKQPDPTDSSPIIFRVVFSAPVTGFATGDVTLSGTAGATTATVLNSGDSTFFLVAISGMTANGTVIADVSAGVAVDASSNPNQASTSRDNTVTFNGFVTSSSFVVTKTADTNDGLCDVDCSLRESIVAANGNLGVDSIVFDIPVSDPGRNPATGVFTIVVDSALGQLPGITDRVTIDGYTQGTISTPGDTSDDATPNTNALVAGLNTRLLIELTDDAMGVDNGLIFDANSFNSRIRGLSIVGFSSAGIIIVFAEGINIEGSFLGVRADGTTVVPNLLGIHILAAPRATIGGLTPGTSNLISGNAQAGIFISGVFATGEEGNTILNNLIGTNALGAGALGILPPADIQGSLGVFRGGVVIGDAGGVQVGLPNAGNVISGNNGPGVLIAGSNGRSDTSNNIVQANFIGVTADAEKLLPNNGDGVEIRNGQNNLIGGLNAGEGNMISSNLANGIAFRTLVLGSESNDNTVAGNTVTANAMDGVLVVSGIRNRINANSIFSNSQEGIDLIGDGVTLNDLDDVDPVTDPNANNLQNYPVISSAAANSLGTTITGTVDGGIPGTSYFIEFFSNAACDGANGEGQTFVGSISTDPSDASGDVSFAFHTNAILIGQIITSTATDNITNDTSEFSVCFLATGEVSRPTVTINQAIGQADPANSAPINFTIVFSEPVDGFQTGDVTLSGTAGATTGTITGSGTNYNVAVSGMTNPGTVIATIAAGVATDAAGNPNIASTSTDNIVTFDGTPPSVTINQAAGQADFTNSSPINFTVVFSEAVNGFQTGDVTLSGTAGATTGTVTGSGAIYNVAVSGMTQSGTVIATIAAGMATDAAGNPNTASTSTDNIVIFDTVQPTVRIGQALGQSDPTTSAPINFTVVFSEPVNGFETGDVTLSGTAGATTAIVTSDGPAYNVAVSGMTQTGTVIATIAAGVATDAAGNPNTASTALDNTVTFNVPGQLQFSSATFSVNESGPAGSIVITRTGGSGGQVSVTFDTSNGTATAGTDYTAVNNFTVTFADGDVVETVMVPITNDAVLEPDEFLNLSLTNPTGGATLGSPNTATLTIIDNDTPTVQFSPTSYTVTEDCTFVTISATRTGDPSASVTVQYASSPIQASERSDYTTAIGTLRFGAGVTTASFALLISEDSLVEATEMLSINLSNPTGGAQLGAGSTAIVEITDDSDTGSGPNAIDDAGTFVCQHYHDFLARQADEAGQLFWTDQITACGTDQACLTEKRTNVSAAFFLSVEFQKTGYFVLRIYKTAFGNQPTNPRYNTFIADTADVNRGVVVGQGTWEADLLANQQAFLLAFVSRSDFMATYPPGQSAAQYVDALFLSAGVMPTAAERQAAIDAYGSGDANGRAAALRSVVESDTIYNAFYNPAFVLLEYFGYLRRNPNDAPDANFAGYNFWLAKMDSFSLPGENVRDEEVALSRVRRAEMVLAFITSGEYRHRFGP